MILTPRSINRRLQIARVSDILVSVQDGEVVVCEVETGVAFGLERCAEEDEVFGDGGVEDY
jgi:hypothetical protein